MGTETVTRPRKKSAELFNKAMADIGKAVQLRMKECSDMQDFDGAKSAKKIADALVRGEGIDTRAIDALWDHMEGGAE